MIQRIVCRVKPYGFLQNLDIIGDKAVAESHMRQMRFDTSHPEAWIPWYSYPVNATAQREFVEADGCKDFSAFGNENKQTSDNRKKG